MNFKWHVWLLSFWLWPALASAQEVCVLSVTIRGNACNWVPPRSDVECTSYRYQVQTDRDVSLQPSAAAQATACPKPGCTLNGGDADAPALKLLGPGGAVSECSSEAPARRTPAPLPALRAKPATTVSKALSDAILETRRPRAQGQAREPEAAGEPFARLQLAARTDGQATGAGAVVDELLRTVAAVALERAQTRAAQRLIDVARQALCGEGAEDARRKTWQQTCEVLDALTPATLGSVAEALRQALVSDVTRWIAEHAAPSSQGDREALPELLSQALQPLLARPGDATREDLLRLVNALVSREWEGAHADVLNLAFYVLRVCHHQGEGEECDPGAIIEAALPVLCQREAGKLDAPLCELLQTQRLRIELLASRLAPVIAKRSLTRSELKRSLKDCVEVALSLPEALQPAQPAQPGDSAAKLRQARLLLSAMLSDDGYSFALHLGVLLDGQRWSPKVHALLTALLAYARTYKQDVPEGEDPSEKRKQIIETLVEAAADRSQRAGDWIVSVGVGVGFDLLGYQRIDDRDALLVPQLAMPLGVFVQRGPNGYTPGFHGGAFLADVAQYASYQSDGATTDPRWDTALALGGQIGVLLGSIADPFVIGLDARYAPTLFSNAKSSEPAAGGTFRLGLFASYYVPLFDLN